MPILSYAYITRPTILKDNLMQFDDVDSIERKNRLTLTLENLVNGDHEILIELRVALSTLRVTSHFNVALKIFVRGEINGDDKINIAKSL